MAFAAYKLIHILAGIFYWHTVASIYLVSHTCFTPSCADFTVATMESYDPPEDTNDPQFECDLHPYSRFCRHPCVEYDPKLPLNQRLARCAASFALYENRNSWQSLSTNGTSGLQGQRNELAHRTLSCELPVRGRHGLLASTGRIFGVSVDVVKNAHSDSGGITQEAWNARLLAGTAKKPRAKRWNAYPLEYVFRFFHHDEFDALSQNSESEWEPPDKSIQVEPNKNERGRRKGRKTVHCAGKARKFDCTYKIRKVRMFAFVYYYSDRIELLILLLLCGACFPGNKIRISKRLSSFRYT